MLERNHLAIIHAVEARGSLTAAAKALHVSQSALSHSIRKLEDRLGVEVWQREGRHLQLTQAGEYLLALAQRLLPQLTFAEQQLQQFARGERGSLRIGMECHPCYQWLLKVVAPYLTAWPTVDLDVKREFQFGGIAALFAHEIDLLVTPDPISRPGLEFQAIFDYEQVLVVARNHGLASKDLVEPSQLQDEVLITYPVSRDRLDIFKLFLSPAGIMPKRHKTIETTDIILQMVASGRGVTALPRWLVAEYAEKLPIVPLRLGPDGIAKTTFIGARQADLQTDYIKAFLQLARRSGAPLKK